MDACRIAEMHVEPNGVQIEEDQRGVCSCDYQRLEESWECDADDEVGKSFQEKSNADKQSEQKAQTC